MQVRVLPFGVLRDWLGGSASTVELPEAATVGSLVERVGALHPALPLRGIAVSVNAEYATADHVLEEGDEVGLLPPVSGGGVAARHVLLTNEPIQPELFLSAAKQGEDGAHVVFDGIVRNNSNGRQTVYLEYEAYAELAVKQMGELVEEAIGRFGVHDAWIVHRLGRLRIGETSVLIIVTSAHRAEAFEACRWLIDTLKKTVPIWKKETFVDGTVWAAGEPFPAEIAVAPSKGSNEA